MDNWEQHIRDNPLIFFKFVAIEYMRGATDREWAADVMQDILNSIANQTEPKFDVNRRGYLEALAYIARANSGQPAPPAAPRGRKAAPKEQPACFRPPDKLAAWKYAQSIGIAQAAFESWWEYAERTDWTAADGKIRKWHAALRGYAAKYEERDNSQNAGDGKETE